MKLKAIMTGALAAVLLAGCGSGGKASAPVVRPVKVYRVEPLGAVDKDFAGMSPGYAGIVIGMSQDLSPGCK